ncbi:hypothetical protein J4H92_12850 [Leucobacter weissii]|uniref:PBP domain-containing protein n=1 Tax=Leucobacter weissii TaxID=1983706 RepID=A0A939MKU9_9MICO|nr:hypothetical protein [Leucobacter weissii]MBO1902834.1 hypothetical protein [Leucobacter weissii]
MKNIKKYTAALASVGVVATLLAIAPTAHADRVEAPAAAGDFAVVGSDTLQDVVAAFAEGTTVTGSFVRATANGDHFASFHATGTTPNITAKVGGPSFGRPNGSGDGVKALSASVQGINYTSGTAGSTPAVNISGQVDIARSSSGPGSNPGANPSGPLVYLPFGRDALAYAYSGGNAALSNLNADQLKSLFECQTTTIGGVTVTPVIPQAGSGSRSDFLSKIGNPTLGSCVVIGQEHDTAHLADGTTPFPNNAVTPISVAQWVSQKTGAAASRIGATVQLGTPTGTAPVTGEGVNTLPNASYYSNSTWGRDTYLVVEYARIDPNDPKYDAKLDNLLGETGSKLLSNQDGLPSQAGAVKQKFGFLEPSTTDFIRANFRN